MAQSAEINTSVEHIPASEQGRGFPPFDPKNFPSQIFWLVLAFVALYLILWRAALPRISGILQGRQRHIGDLLGEAQHFKAQSDDAIAAHEKALMEARARAQTLANETRERAAASAEARRKQVEANLNARIAEADKAIAARRQAAMGSVRTIASEAATAIVERLTGTAPANHEVLQAVGDVLKH
jgi:F-type H+-transporting ATPase subunit b